MIKEQLEELFIKYLERLPTDRELELHGDKNEKYFEKELLDCNERKDLIKRKIAQAERESNSMSDASVNDVINLYKKFLLRDPTAGELQRDVKKNLYKLEKEISNCEERQQIQSRTKIAVLISGHLRNQNIVKGLIPIWEQYKIDTFVYSWDNFGHKGTEMNFDDKVDPDKIRKEIERIPGIKSYKIENNKEFLLKIKKETENTTYFNYSSPEIFIKSQLYTIAKTYELMENYSKTNNVNYDLVLKLRFDLSINKFEMRKETIELLKENKIILIPKNSDGHAHPNFGHCPVCHEMYYDRKMTVPHIFPHVGVICDIWAMGNQESMKDYCSMYYHYDKILKKYTKESLEFIERHNIKAKKTGNVYNLGHHEAIYYSYASFPENIIPLHLKDYMLLTTKDLEFMFHR